MQDGLDRAAARLPRRLLERALAADGKLSGLWRQLVPAAAPAVLLAVGGYGRKQLFPASDVDVAVVHADVLDDFVRLRLEAFAAAVWSLNLDLAFTARPLSALKTDLATQQELYTSLLFARLLAGPAELALAVRAVHHDCGWNPLNFLEAKWAEQKARHARFADTAYNLEPHLKDGPGGLRDLHTVRWVYAAASGLSDPDALARKRWLEPGEAQALERHERLLGALRLALHVTAGRREERLLFDHQLAIAQALKFSDEGHGRRGVEALMQRYYRTAGAVRELNQRLLDRLESALRPAPEREVLSRHWVREGMRLEAVDPAALAAQPDLLLDGFRLLATHPQWQALGPRTQRVLPAVVAGLAPEHLQMLARALIDALARPAGAARLLRLCAASGLLGRLLPAFEQVRGRMQFDLFHSWTVDEHTLRLLDRLEALQHDETSADFALPQVVWMRIRRPELLYLAGLFHDIAKGRGGDHSELGAEEAREWLAGLGLDREAGDTVSWLVAEHLSMSITAQKQDVSDPEVIQRFAAKVGDAERLNLLFLLTVADIQATNPKLWNGWKARLIADLYEQTRFQLRRGAAQRIPDAERISVHRDAALGLLRGEGAGWRAIEAVWADVPPQSFLRLKPDELRWVTQAMLAHGEQPGALVAVRRSAGAEGYQVFVRAPDQPGLFATITAVLDACQLSVLGARIATCASGKTLDTFEAVDLSGATDAVARSMELQLKLRMALDEQPLRPRPTRRLTPRQQKAFRIPLKLDFDPELAHGRTQLALIGPDRPGLLARVALVFHTLGIRVHAARIATFGERAEDFFELSDPADQPLEDSAQLALATALRAALES